MDSFIDHIVKSNCGTKECHIESKIVSSIDEILNSIGDKRYVLYRDKTNDNKTFTVAIVVKEYIDNEWYLTITAIKTDEDGYNRLFSNKNMKGFVDVFQY